MENETLPPIGVILARLLHSRKVVLALVAWLTGAVGLLMGAVTAEMFLTLTEALFASVILGIAIEDHGTKSGGAATLTLSTAKGGTLSANVDASTPAADDPAAGRGIVRRPPEADVPRDQFGGLG